MNGLKMKTREEIETILSQSQWSLRANGEIYKKNPSIKVFEKMKEIRSRIETLEWVLNKTK